MLPPDGAWVIQGNSTIISASQTTANLHFVYVCEHVSLLLKTFDIIVLFF